MVLFATDSNEMQRNDRSLVSDVVSFSVNLSVRLSRFALTEN